jgi:hypothetical protein
LEVLREVNLALAIVTPQGISTYHKRGIRCQAFSGSKKTLHLVMCFSFPGYILLDIQEVGPIAVTEDLVMENWNLPGTLSPCVRIFLEVLCSELREPGPAESRVFEQKRPESGVTRKSASLRYLHVDKGAGDERNRR